MDNVTPKIVADAFKRADLSGYPTASAQDGKVWVDNLGLLRTDGTRTVVPTPENVPTAVTDYLAADGTYKPFSASSISTALGYTPLSPNLNLSDVISPATALANLGGANDSLVAHLAGAETFTGAKTFSAAAAFTNTLAVTGVTSVRSNIDKLMFTAVKVLSIGSDVCETGQEGIAFGRSNGTGSIATQGAGLGLSVGDRGLTFYTSDATALVARMKLDSTALSPITTAGLSLGSTTNKWQDLELNRNATIGGTLSVGGIVSFANNTYHKSADGVARLYFASSSLSIYRSGASETAGINAHSFRNALNHTVFNIDGVGNTTTTGNATIGGTLTLPNGTYIKAADGTDRISFGVSGGVNGANQYKSATPGSATQNAHVFRNGSNSSIFYIQGNGDTIVGGQISASGKLSISPTWNSAFGTFTALLVNPTDTASAAGSLIADFQVGGASKFSIDKSGNASVTGTFASGTGFTVDADGDTTAKSLTLPVSNAVNLTAGRATFTCNGSYANSGIEMYVEGAAPNPPVTLTTASTVMLIKQYNGTRRGALYTTSANQYTVFETVGAMLLKSSGYIDMQTGAGLRVYAADGTTPASLEVGATTITRPNTTNGLTVDYTTAVNTSAVYGVQVKDTTNTRFSVSMSLAPNAVFIGYGMSAGTLYSSSSAVADSHTIAGRTQVHSSGTTRALALYQNMSGTGTARANLLDLAITGTHTGTGGRYLINGTTGGVEKFTVTDGGNITTAGTLVAAGSVTQGYQSSVADPLAADIPSNSIRGWKNTVSGNLFLAANDSGTIKKLTFV